MAARRLWQNKMENLFRGMSNVWGARKAQAATPQSSQPDQARSGKRKKRKEKPKESSKETKDAAKEANVMTMKPVTMAVTQKPRELPCTTSIPQDIPVEATPTTSPISRTPPDLQEANTAFPGLANTAFPGLAKTAFPCPVNTAFPGAANTALPGAANTAFPGAANTAFADAANTAFPGPPVNTACPVPAKTAFPCLPSSSPELPPTTAAPAPPVFPSKSPNGPAPQPPSPAAAPVGQSKTPPRPPAAAPAAPAAAPSKTPPRPPPPKKEEPQQQEPAEQPARQVPQVAKRAAAGMQMVRKWVQRALDMGVDALRGEYRSLARYTAPNMTVEAFKANQEFGRNRYQDVPCQDQNRVILKWHCAATDYIHANFVATPFSERRFILTQGPLDGTVNEFWQMVLQEEAETIVMLCNCIETGKNKCSPYWPDRPGDTRQFNGGEVINKQTRILSPEELSVIVCVLDVKFTQADGSKDTREVRHYQWRDWPDRGVPPCRLTSMELLSRVRGTNRPIVVHCSAGIGRTGTIVAIEYILERMQAGRECAAMNDLLKELRNQRAYTIQNDLQYLYIHRVMLCYFLEKHRNRYEAIMTEENIAKYKKFVQDYNTATNT